MTWPAVEVPQGLAFSVLAWAAWGEGDEGVVSGGACHAAAPLPATLRRRITPIGRKALETAWAVLAGRGETSPRIILSSRHGEYARTCGLLGSLAESGEVSPAEFSLAVHHGLAGLLSIVTGNRAGHSAVSAGSDSFGAALTEAAACLADGESQILLMHYDEPLPRDYAPVSGTRLPGLALALLISSQDGERIVLNWEPADGKEEDCAATALLRLLKGAENSQRASGARMVWSFHHAA